VSLDRSALDPNESENLKSTFGTIGIPRSPTLSSAFPECRKRAEIDESARDRSTRDFNIAASNPRIAAKLLFIARCRDRARDNDDAQLRAGI